MNGLITTAQLDECLKCQVIFGGRLGTNLVEMGYLKEQDLAVFLSKKMGVPHVEAKQIDTIPREVIELIPRELVEKFKVLPLKLDRKRLAVAMTDPNDYVAIDEVSFRTGFILTPVVIPEIRLFFALEKYYGIKRERRYITVAGEKGRARPEPEIIRESERKDAVTPARDKITVSPVPEKVTGQAGNAPQSHAQTLDHQEIDLEELVQLDEFTGFNLDDDYLVSPGKVRQEQDAPTAVADEEKPDPMELLSHQLASSNDRDHIAMAVLDYAGCEFKRAAMLIVRGNTANGWMARMDGKHAQGFEFLQIPLDAPSVVKIVAEGKSPYLGPVPDTPCNQILMTGLGGGNRQSVLLLPLLLMGKVVAILYVDGGAQDLNNRLAELKRVVVKASMAFEILILKNKILSL